jgi:hypothetical protein
MLAQETKNASQSSFSLTTQSSSAARFDRDNGHFYKKNTVTQETLVTAYGKGRGKRAKCPCCGGNNLSVDRQNRFKCFNGCDGSSLYWAFVADGLLEHPSQQSANTPSIRPSQVHELSTPTRSLASPNVRDRVYRAMLELCPLSEKHKRDLRRRCINGLFETLEMGTLDFRGKRGDRIRLVLQILEATGLTREELAGVGGFYMDAKGCVHLANMTGLLIPFYDLKHRIVGLQVRADKAEKGRYRWFSCGGKGVSSGAPVGFLEGFTNSKTLDFTEGALKAVGLLSNLSDTRGVVYLAGVGMTSGIADLISEIGSVERCRVWFDADSLTKPEVLAALGRLVRLLMGLGLVVEVKGWELDQGKGIDDYLANGYRIEETHTLDTEGILRGATLRKQSAHLISSVAEGKRETPILPVVQEVFSTPTQPTLAESRERTEAAFVAAIQAPAGTFTLHNGPTGSGKTTAFATHATAGKIYAARNYKVLLEAKEACEAENKPVKVLYGRGRRIDENADEETQAIQREIWDQAGCEYIEQAERLGARGYFPCLDCPLFNTDPEERAKTCRYWGQRKAAIDGQSENIILTLAQTLASNHEATIDGQQEMFDASGSHTVVFDDIADPTMFFRPTDVNLDDVEQWSHSLPSRIGPEEQRRDRAYAAAATEIRLQLGDPSRPRALLYKAGKEAANFLDLEARTFRLFRPDRGEDRPPLNVFESLMDWLFRGLEVSFVGTGKERALRFLRPSPILTNLSKGRVVWLDATPNKELMTWFAGTLGMDCVETNIPQPIQQITQIVDRLWTGGQLDNHPEAVGLLDFAEDNNALIIRKKARAQEGEAYFGRDERALNAYKDAPFTVLEGHHAMSDEQATQSAWMWKAFAAYQKRQAPLQDAPTNPPKTARIYGDSWRKWERVQHTLSDPLAENIRRHHYSTTILQAVARDRDPNKPKYVLSGSPIEYDGKPYPVKVWTLSDLRSFLESQGIYVPKKERVIPAKLRELNEERKATNRNRIEEAIARLEGMGGINALPRITDVRRALGGKSAVRSPLAREVWEALGKRYQSEQYQGLGFKTDWGTHTDVIYTNTCVCPHSGFKVNSLETKENDFGSVCVPALSVPPPPVALCVPLPREEEQEDICTGIFTRETERSPDIPPPDLPSEREVAEGREEGEEKAGLEGLFEDEVCIEIHSPLPRGEEAANPPPSEGEKEGEERRENVVWSWWMWLGGVEVWRAWEDDPNEANCSVLDALLCEMRRHVPEYRRLEILDVLKERMDRQF